MDKLKSCPFCGGEATLAHDLHGTVSYIKCNDVCCGVHGRKFPVSSGYASDEKAVEFWNNRKVETDG